MIILFMIALPDFEKLQYLQAGTLRQREAYTCLESLKVFNDLKEYNPILAGTIPLNIDLPDSDLDIICNSDDLQSFRSLIIEKFGHYESFSSSLYTIDKDLSFVANFKFSQFEIEIFCQKKPSNRQNAYLHMVVEAKLLKLAGPKSCEAIRGLKIAGLKTEPAFAKLFSIDGNDPYKALLELADASEEEIEAIVKRWGLDSMTSGGVD